MAYAYRYLTAAEEKDIKAQATAKPGPPVPDEGMLRAWEADLAAHRALLAAKTGDDRKPHADAIAALETALSAAPPPAKPPTPR